MMTEPGSKATLVAQPRTSNVYRSAEVTTVLCPRCTKENMRRARFCQHCGFEVVLNNDAPADEPRYYLTRVIKQGGQGAVFEGIDAENNVYAVKVMLDRFTDPKERDEAITRFNEEAELLQSLSHPRIPRVYSHFTDEGRHYLTMDFVRGEDLEQIVDRDGTITEKQVIEWAAQILDVLEYLHLKDLIYRDMKPSNVMIEPNRSVKLIDFGIAKLFKPTERGTQIGTPGYAPPEQYQGLATPASDIYALAATLHHLLTGRDPTDNAPFSFPPARDVNPAVSQRTSDALQKALQMKPEDRWGNVAEFRDALIAATPKPAQVRVAPATVRLPQQQAQAARGGAGTPAVQTVPAPSAPPQVAPPPAPPAARAKAAPQPATTGGFFAGVQRFIQRLLTTIIVFAVVAVLALGATYIWLPDVAEQYLPALPPQIEQIIRPEPTSGPLRTQSYEVTLRVQVPSGASELDVRAALRDAFAAAAIQQFGAQTQILSGTVSPVGTPVLISDENGIATYEASVRGFVQVP